MRYFNNSAPRLIFLTPSTQIAVLGVTLLVLSGVSVLFRILLTRISSNYLFDKTIIESFIQLTDRSFKVNFCMGIILFIIAVIVGMTLSDSKRICVMVKKGLFCFAYGNPLHLKDGELLPAVMCQEIELGVYELTITATTATVDDIQNVSSSISSSLNRRYKQYAVTATNVDIAFNEVCFTIEDVTVHKELVIHSVEELQPKEPTKLIIQQGTFIDLTTSGSMLFSGKTRSGKSTGVISLLLQVLLSGRDKYGSEIVIIDPKQAELSRLPHVYSLDENGEATGILNAIKNYADTIVRRQRVLNELSEKKGDAVHWWEAGFHVSILFIDEYVSARTMFPKRAGKDNSEYCLATFDGLIKRIVTMGASAGCYAIISIAEASVEEGGLPSMLRSAMSTKILFKPTLTEGRLMWDSDKLKDFSERVYNAGDAWFSSTDGIHDNVSFVHFPIMDFPVYRELGKLLEQYYTKA